VDHKQVAAWLNAYSDAWRTYDPHAIGALFSEDAVYIASPFEEPVRGRAGIVSSWLEQPDQADTYESHYEPLVVEGDRAVANGRSRYFDGPGGPLKSEWDNIFVLRFDADGRCVEYREWYNKRPDAKE
jgi:ketosteroid isomerase-like protein